MKRTIRNGVFETNSSSVHSMVIKREVPLPENGFWFENRFYRKIEDDDEIELEKNEIPISERGTIWGHFGVYDRDYGIFSKQYEKLNYLLTLCYYASRDFDEMLESSAFRRVESVVCDYTGAKQIKFSTKVKNRIRKIEEDEDYWNDYCYIDHQSAPYDGIIEFIDIYDENAIKRFIWGKGLYLMTTGD